MKAQMSIDPKLIKLLGQKMYSTNPVTICVRELLQNAADACKRKGVEPDIKLSIVSNKRRCTIECSDNGIGMTDTQIVTDFLCLGGTSKRGEAGNTGGFGIAKAVIMSGEYWSVQSLDSICDSDTIVAGDDISKLTEPVDGTIVTAEFADQSIYYWLDDVLCLIAFSDIKVWLTVEENGHMLLSDHVGLTQEKVFLAKGELQNWSGYGLQKVQVGEHMFSSKCMVRLNGLVQFGKWVYGNSMEGNIVVDIHTTEDPSSPAYPFPTSREKMNSEIDSEVDKWMRQRAKSSYTTDKIIKRGLEDDEIQYVTGRVLRGKRKSGGPVEDSLKAQAAESSRAEHIEDWIRAAQSVRTPDQEILEFVDQYSNQPIMRLMNYAFDEDTAARDAKIVSAWCAVLETVLLEGQAFGVGLTSEKDTMSELKNVQEILFFVINPDIFTGHESNEGIILSMWQYACSEASHINNSDFAEQYSMMVTYLMSSTSDAMFQNLSHIARLLS